MKLTQLQKFEEPLLKDIVNMSDDYLFDKYDITSKYWKTYHYLNLILPLRTILNRCSHNASKCPHVIKRMIEDELNKFYKDAFDF